MFKKEYLVVFIIIGLSVAYAFFSLIVLLTRRKWTPGIRKKIAIGAAIVTFTAILNYGSNAFAQDAPSDPTPTPVYGTLAPTSIATPDPMVDYAAPTAEATFEPVPEYAAPTPEATFEPVPEYGVPTIEPVPIYGIPLFGDVDSDEDVDIVDALLIAQFYVKMPVENFNEMAADVNCSMRIDIIDALLVAQKYVKILEELPVCE
jgi:hypothetical protein